MGTPRVQESREGLTRHRKTHPLDKLRDDCLSVNHALDMHQCVAVLSYGLETLKRLQQKEWSEPVANMRRRAVAGGACLLHAAQHGRQQGVLRQCLQHGATTLHIRSPWDATSPSH